MRKKKYNSVLALDTGDFFKGATLSGFAPTKGEVCFTTAMTGYQEVITDPSYAGQIVVFSFPHIGNTGINGIDFQSSSVHLSGIVIGECITQASNHEAQLAFDKWLIEKGVAYIEQVDTRSLIRIISESHAPIRGIIKSKLDEFSENEISSLCEEAQVSSGLAGKFLANNLTEIREQRWSSSVESKGQQHRLVLIDFGFKEDIPIQLAKFGYDIHVLPFDTKYQDILSHSPCGIVLSNGPGDPMAAPQSVVDNVACLLSSGIPTLGICMGYQLMARSLGMRFVQLPCGHHGTNHPVRDVQRDQVIITSQNHEFVMDESTINDGVVISHRSLFDNTVEGFHIDGKDVFAYQFHPEASPGPEDAQYVFHNFRQAVEKYAQKK